MLICKCIPDNDLFHQNM